MEERELLSRVRRLYSSDEISWESLLAPDNLAKLRDLYNFREFTLVRETTPPALRGTGGQVKGPVRTVTELKIEPQAIELTVQGDSELADTLLFEVQTQVLSLSAIVRSTNPKVLVDTHETFCVCKLDFEWDRMFSPTYNEFLKSVRERVSEEHPEAEAELWPAEIRYVVALTTKAAEFRYAPKMLAIEPRKGAAPGDRLYWTNSPLKSDQHLSLLRELESAFRATRRQ